jgi:His-Xaa-Ser system protein HxsD
VSKKVGNGIRVVKFDVEVYGCNAIRRAAYKFRGRVSVAIEQRDSFNQVRLIQSVHCDSFYTLVSDFCNEVLDQELRERVAREMIGLRNLLSPGASKFTIAKCASRAT